MQYLHSILVNLPTMLLSLKKVYSVQEKNFNFNLAVNLMFNLIKF